MKKYFLTFLDAQLEEKYQSQLRQIQYIIFVVITITSLPSLIFMLLVSSKTNQVTTAKIIMITLLVIFTIQFIVIYNRKTYVPQGLLFISICSILGQITPPEANVNQAFIAGGNILTIFIILLYGLEFKYGAISNLLSMMARLIYSMNQASDSYQVLINLAIIHACIFFCLYYKELYYRRSFLQNTNNQLLEKTFSILQDQAFFVFQYDSDQLRFNLKDSHQIVHDDIPQDFHDFLRQSIYQQKSLELFLFYKIKQQSLKDYETLNNMTLEVQYQKKNYQVKLVEIFLTSITFFLIIKPKSKRLEADAIQKNNARIMKQIYQFSVSQEKFIKNFILKYTQKYQLLRLRRYYFQVICAQRLQLSNLVNLQIEKQVNLGKQIQQIIQLFRGFRIIVMEQSKIQIDIIKLHLFLVELFNLYESSETTINIKIISEYLSVMLIIFSPPKLFKSIQLQNIENQLVAQIIRNIDRTVYIFNTQCEQTFSERGNLLK